MALTTGQKLGWGLADLGVSTFFVVKSLLVLDFLTSFLGVPAEIAGFATTFVLAFDVITDPVIGYLSDRTRSRWGRRVPWIAAGAVIMVGGIIGIYAVPDGWTWQANMTWVVGFFALATVGFTCVVIPYGAMAGEMTRDPRERSVMTAFRMTFSSVGLLVAGAAVPALAGGTKEGFLFAFLLAAPLSIASIWGMLWATRRAPRIETTSTLPPLKVARLVIGNKGFLALVLLYGLMSLSVTIIAAGLRFVATYLIGNDGSGPLSGMIEAFGIFAALFAFFVLGTAISQYGWVRMSAALGKLNALIVGLLCYAGVLTVTYFLLPTDNATLMAVMFFAAGLANGSYQQIPWAMYPDHMDVSRNATGQPLEAGFAAVWLFGQKVAGALAPATVGVILAAAGWQESTGGVVEQTPEALEALRRVMTLWPVGIFLASVLGLLLIYRPLARGVHERA